MSTAEPCNVQAGRFGGWITTYTGRKFWPLDPRPEDLDIRDIAHALSLLCRYTGHCAWHYSVAQHSVYVCRNLPPPFKRWGLMHDASEAYLLDLAKPVKEFIPQYKEFELKLERVIAARFDLPWPMPPEVKEADTRMLMTEAPVLLPDISDWTTEAEPYADQHIVEWTPHGAERAFMHDYKLLWPNSK